MADDLGRYALGAYGGAEFETPRLDDLARQGMKLTNCHSRAMCTPTRNVLLTGKGLHRATRTERRPADPTLADVFNQAGYHTGFAGKWMTGGMPWNAGFEEGVCQVNWYRYWGPHVVVWNSGGYLKDLNLPEPLPERMKDHGLPIKGPQPRATHLDGEYGPRILNRFALDYIERHQDEPFVLYYPLKLPHAPIMPTPETPRTPEVEKAIAASNALPVGGDNYALPASHRWIDDTVAEVDRLVGNVMDKLQACGLDENTILVFTSDNGPGTDGDVAPGVERIPGGKGGTLDGATRGPCLIRWPGVVAPGSTYDGLVDFSDFLPTLLDAVGAKRPDGADFDGRSFLPQLRGKRGNPREWIYFHAGWHPSPSRAELVKGRSYRRQSYAPEGHEPTPRINYEFTPHFRYVRGTRYKLYSDGRFYDLQDDLLERHPVKPGTGTPEVEAARKQLQGVLDNHPKKENEPTYTYE
jgi:arylsulfatase A